MLFLSLTVAVMATVQAVFGADNHTTGRRPVITTVFYPENYDASAHQPSPIFVQEPLTVGGDLQSPTPHPSTVNCPLGSAAWLCQELSTVNYQLSTVNYLATSEYR